MFFSFVLLHFAVWPRGGGGGVFSAFFRGSFMNCATDRSGVLRSHKDSFKLQIMDNFFSRKWGKK